MYNSEAYYDSDEEVGMGPITLREEIALLKHNKYRDPTKRRRDTTNGRLQSMNPNKSNATEYFTANDSRAESNMAVDSSLSLEKNHEVVDVSDESVLELSEEECVEDSIEEIINISSTSSSSSDENLSTPPRKSIPTFKIESPRPSLRSPVIINAQNSSTTNSSETMSDTQLLLELSSLKNALLSSNKSLVNTADESLLLQSVSEHDDFVDLEREDINDDSVSYETAKDAPPSSGNNSELSDHMEIRLEIKAVEMNLEEKEILARDIDKAEFQESEIYSPTASVDNNDEFRHADIKSLDSDVENIEDIEGNVDTFNSTFDRIECILNSGGGTKSKEVTPKRTTSVLKESYSAPNIRNPSICTTPGGTTSETPFKVPTKIPRSVKKEFLHTPRSRYDNIKSPVAHYIKNSPSAPLIRNEPCKEVTVGQLFAMADKISPKSVNPRILWPKITLPEKFYNRGEVEIVPEYKAKVLKLPANIEAITMNMGVIKRHLGHRVITSRLPVPHSPSFTDDVDNTFTTQKTPREDVSLIAQQNVIID